MALTAAQLATLKADILADPILSAQPMNSDGAFEIARLYNLQAEPAFVVWRTAVSLSEITQSDSWAWVEVDNLTVGKARLWEWMFDAGEANPAKPNVRAGIVECWSGTAGRNAVQAAVLAVCKRNSTRAEKLFATGTGTTQSPATMEFEGMLSYQDVEAARNS
jgi:hypothetical protein